jgi:sugar phosphate isomerase/epimerase
VKDAEGKIHWAPVGTGYIDWTAQFKALAASGYREAVSLETHWRGASTPEASTRISWQQMEQALKNSGTLT